MPLRLNNTTDDVLKSTSQHLLKARKKKSPDNQTEQKPKKNPENDGLLCGKDYAQKFRTHDLPELLNISEVARLLNISRHMVRHLIDNGTLAHIRIGERCRRVYRQSVECLIREKSSD